MSISTRGSKNLEYYKEVIININIKDYDLYLKVDEQLAPGLILKNYNELCSTLDLPIVGGKQKELQMKNLERFCKYEKQGHKFVITEVYDSPYEKEDKRVNGNNSVFVTYIETLLLNQFIRNDGCKLTFTKRQLWEMLGMVNANYTKYFEKKKLAAELQVYEPRLRQWHIDRFYSRSRKKLNDIVKSALNSLKRRKLIDYRDDVIVACKGKKQFEVTRPWQLEKILEIERETLDELVGATKKIIRDGKEVTVPTDMRDILFNSDKKVNLKKYLDLRNKKLQATLGFDFIYKRYRIVCNRKYLERGLAENEQMLRQALNLKVVDSVNELAQKDFDKNRADLKSGKIHFIYPNYYMDIQKLLSAKLLNIDEKMINEFFETMQLDAELEELFSA